MFIFVLAINDNEKKYPAATIEKDIFNWFN